MEADTQPHPGWGIICCDCRYVFDDEDKHVDYPPAFPCKRMRYDKRIPIFRLKRLSDGSETCTSFKEHGLFEDEEARPFKRWFFVRHIRYMYLCWRYTMWWISVGRHLGLFMNPSDEDYLQKVWIGEQ
jgi:hypothetical protein